MRFTNTGVLGAVVPVQSQWRRHLAVALTLLSLAALTIAWSRPSGVDRVPRERATIVLVLDVSQSMAATDVKPNRLDAAKTEAKRFVASIPATYNVALVSLSGAPASRLPPTTDRGQINRAIDALTLQDSTAIGDAINVAMATLQSAPKAADGSIPPGAIVLLSDGQNTAGRSPTQEAAEAAKAKLLERVKASFAQYDFIGNIELIPSQYLRPKGGFDNLEQVARMFNVEVMALLSYDQVQFDDSNALSVLYWTIIGAYIVHGDQYDIQTMLDASVFDLLGVERAIEAFSSYGSTNPEQVAHQLALWRDRISENE